ncbi:hypothetical protein SK128_013585 [Halocaridina rubra]|uniref:Uncharacterized protein n=1 Tax=Halocaridina rubra TaxID=373956 RepID=A0AAN8XBW0_HALRR
MRGLRKNECVGSCVRTGFVEESDDIIDATTEGGSKTNIGVVGDGPHQIVRTPISGTTYGKYRYISGF